MVANDCAITQGCFTAGGLHRVEFYVVNRSKNPGRGLTYYI